MKRLLSFSIGELLIAAVFLGLLARLLFPTVIKAVCSFFNDLTYNP